MGVSRKCVKTWLDRYAGEGEPGLPRGRTDGVDASAADLRSQLASKKELTADLEKQLKDALTGFKNTVWKK